jgi:hypothetical protein
MGGTLAAPADACQIAEAGHDELGDESMLRRAVLAAACAAWPMIGFAQTGDIPTGRYECWYFTTPLPGMNFVIQGGGRYVDVEGKNGSYTVASGQIAFKGGALDGQHALFKPQKPPTIAFLGTGGRETETCQPSR